MSQPGRKLPIGCLTCRADPLGVAPPTRKSLQCKWVAISTVHNKLAWLLILKDKLHVYLMKDLGNDKTLLYVLTYL